MQSKPRTTISLKLDKKSISPFYNLLQNGFRVEQILNEGSHELKSAGGLLVIEGKELRYDQPYTINWSRVTEELLLKVSSYPE